MTNKPLNNEFERKLWDFTLHEGLHNFMINVKDEDGETLESEDNLSDFYEHVKSTVSQKDVVKLSIEWNDLSENEQVLNAVALCGEYHASRFMMMMDYLGGDGSGIQR